MVEGHSSVLLDAKTNELGIIEFSVGDALYGINVAKVREIIKAPAAYVPVPEGHPSINGVINLRGMIIPVVDLARHINVAATVDVKQNRVIVAEFNRITIGFLVSSVSRIHRLLWKDVEVPSRMFEAGGNYTSGIVKVGKKVIFLLDFERVASQINPHANIQPPRDGEHGSARVDRSSKKILVVDDSAFTLQLIIQHLHSAGYQTDTAANGQEAWNRLVPLRDSAAFKDISQCYHLLVTDIEMPQMDGLHLIRKIKDDPKLRRLPCIAFSSIISKEIIVQCRKFGADAEISKPEISQLVARVDAIVL